MSDYIEICKERVREALERFEHVLRFVPDDRLTWSPAPTAKSALQIAAHCAGYSSAFASIIAAGAFPWSLDEFHVMVNSAIDSVATLAEAQTMLRKGIADTIAAIDTVRPEQIGAMVEAPHAAVPFTFFLTLPARHLEMHGAQIDYLQTCWGDLEVHL